MQSIVLAALLAIALPDPADLIIEVEAGPQAREASPVVLAWPEGREVPAGIALETVEDHQAVPVQLIPGDRPEIAWIVRGLPAGSTRRYRLKSTEKAPGGERAACREDGGALVLSVGDRPVLRYHAATLEPPAGVDPKYRRSGFIHPIESPEGRVVTDDFPPDHAHQHGLFFAWVNASFDGHPLDFWNQLKGTGNIRHLETLGTAGGPVVGQFAARLRHEDTSRSGEEAVPVLDEVWTVRAFDVEGIHLIDLESVQTCAGPLPLEINEYHYGGLGLRGNRDWLVPENKQATPPDPDSFGRSDFLTGEGKGRADGNHTRPRWVDLSGLVEGRYAGVTLLDHPSNFRFPQPVRLHPTKPYFCFAPMVLGSFAIEPGRPYISRYRLIAHDGRPDPEAIERLWRDYADPPRVRFLE